MADLATLGFAVDSSPLARAKSAMQDMVPAAREAGTAVDGMVDAVNKTKPAVDGATNAINKTKPAVDGMSNAVNGAKTATDGLVNSTGRASIGLNTQSATVTRLANDYNRLSDMQRRINATTGVTGLSLGGDRGADIAAYGREMDALRAKFNPLFAAGQQYKATLAEINQAQRVGAISQKEYADAIMSTKVAFTAQVNSLRGVTDQQEFFNRGSTATGRAANDNAKAFQGMSFEAKNLSYQLVDVTQGLVSGQPVFQIFAQQAGQIGQVIATSPNGLGGLMKELGRSIAGLLTPMRLLTVGIVGLGIGLFALVKNAIDSSKALDDLAKSIDFSLQKLHGLQQIAGGRGIGTDDFAAGMKNFGDEVYRAQRGMGDLAGLMRANGRSAKDFQGYMQEVANLVARAGSDQNAQKLLESINMPANQEWVRYWRDLSKGIDAATAATVQFNDAAEKNMIEKAREFDKWWNESTTKLVNYFKSAAISIAEALSNIKIPDWMKSFLSLGATVATGVMSLGLGPAAGVAAAGVNAAKNYMSSGDSFSSRFGAAGTNAANDNSALQNGLDNWAKKFRGGYFPEPASNAAAGPKSKTLAEMQHDNMVAQQRISILGDLATINDQVRAKELELNGVYLASGVSAGKYRDAILNAVRAQAEMSRVQQQASIGVFNLNDANKAAADTLQMWIDKKLLDPNNAQQMAAAMNVLSRNTREMADAASVAGSNLPQLQQALNDAANVNKQIDQFATSSFSSITTGLADIFDGTKTAAQGFADLGKTVLRSLEEMLIKMYIVMPIFNALKGALGGGGLLGSILPGIGGGVAAAVHHAGGVAGSSNVTRMVDPAVFIGAHRYHNGGTAGLAPDEVPAILQRGERITPRGAGNDNTPIINIVGGGINPQDVEIRQTEDGRGNTRTDIVLDQAVANAMSRAGSSTRKAMANNYGARPVGVRR